MIAAAAQFPAGVVVPIAVYTLLTAIAATALVLQPSTYPRVKLSPIRSQAFLAAAALVTAAIHAVAVGFDPARALRALPVHALSRLPSWQAQAPMWPTILATVAVGAAGSVLALRRAPARGLGAGAALIVATCAAFGLATVHAMLGGIAAGRPWVFDVYAGAVGLVASAITWRILAPPPAAASAERSRARAFAWPKLGPWVAVRAVSTTAALALITALVVRPHWALPVFWGLFIPALPIVWFVAPGLWRNVCPLAAVNQAPRLFGFTRGLTLPKRVADRAYLIPVAILMVAIPTRKVVFNTNGPAVAGLLLFVGTAALAGGFVFKGKSGWCSSICPLLPIQRLYGQTPFATVRNSHCNPCLGCVKNCFDLEPNGAYLRDLTDDNPYWAGQRRLFAGAFPGLVLAFFLLGGPKGHHGIPLMYGRFAIFVLASVGLFLVLDTIVDFSKVLVPTLFAATALNVFYWFNIPQLSQRIAHAQPVWVVWGARGALYALSAFWLYRSYTRERRAAAPATGAAAPAASAEVPAADGEPGVRLMPEDRQFAVAAGTSLLDALEQAGVAMEAGCRMGMCGADPVCVTAGRENLSPASDQEAATISRLGFGESTRMACCARVRGPVTVSMSPGAEEEDEAEAKPAEGVDTSIERVVVVGNGIAGITAADWVRRRHPTCAIDVVSREHHPLYNRMAIAKLIHGRSGMRGLYLQPDEWYEKNRITTWLNTRATAIDRAGRTVTLATGERLEYDRLILAPGSSSFVPPITGMGMPGTYSLREAEDGMRIRAYVQENESGRAVVSGGGLLGLEAAYALQQIGLHVTVLQRGERLLNLQLDEHGSELLLQHMQRLGIDVVCRAEVVEAQGDERLERVVLKDGGVLECDVLLIATGIRPNVELAGEAGLQVEKGIVVDGLMRTSDPTIFAAGDCAQLEGKVPGLWPTAVEQGRIAAFNALGAAEGYSEPPPVTILKVTGVDVMSAGRFEPEDGESVIAQEDVETHRYRKLVVRDGRIVGAILFGCPREAPGVAEAMKQERGLSGDLEAFEAGDWSAFCPDAAPPGDGEPAPAWQPVVARPRPEPEARAARAPASAAEAERPAKPEATAEPEASPEPEQVAVPETTAEADAIAEPESAPEPEPAALPEAAAEAERPAEREPGLEEEPVSEPEPTLEEELARLSGQAPEPELTLEEELALLSGPAFEDEPISPELVLVSRGVAGYSS